MIYTTLCPQCSEVVFMEPSALQHAGLWGAGYARCGHCKSHLQTTYKPASDTMAARKLFNWRKK